MARPTFDFTDTTRVKRIIAGSAGDSDIDDVLGDLIPSATDMIEDFLNRKVELKSRTEILDVEPDQTLFMLRAWPNVTITTIKSALELDWSGATALTANDQYTLRLDEDSEHTGELVISRTSLIDGVNTLQVVYTGGIASSLSALDTAAPGIVSATSHQVAEMYRWRRSPERRSFGRGGDKGQPSARRTRDLTEIAKNFLRPYVRIEVI